MSSAAADTIVLKNGRRIVASTVTEDGDRVRYETPAGSMSIPKSIVARIDRDGLGYSAASSASSEPPVSAPHVDPVRGYDDIARLVIHDNAIDFSYIAQIETDARSHAPLAIEKVAAAHYAAAQFLESKGDTASAIDHYREALSFAPDNLPLLLNLAVLYLQQRAIRKLTNWILKNLVSGGGSSTRNGSASSRPMRMASTNAFVDWLRQRRQDRPFFAFLNYFDAHDPYVPPPGYAGRFGIRPGSRRDCQLSIDFSSLKTTIASRDVLMARDCYDDCIAFLDDRASAIARLAARTGLA